MRYVIIGNSAAGVKAAETLRALDERGDITVVDREPEQAYSRCLLPDFLEGTRGEEEIRIRPADNYRKLGINTFLGRAAVGLRPGSGEVELEGGTLLKYDRLLIATGSSSSFPPLPGLGGSWVFGLRNLSDARNILRRALSARRAVVIGGGFIGLEAALSLKRRGLEVTVVEKMPQILSLQLDSQAAAIMQRDLQAEGIRFVLGRGIRELEEAARREELAGAGGFGVILEDGGRLEAGLVVVATGTRPNLELVRETGMQLNQGIVTGPHLETSLPGVFAAGDVAEAEDALTGERGLSPIWPNAVNQGKVAAYNMAGVEREYSPLLGMQNAVEFREVPAIAVGLTRPPADGYEVLSDYRPDQNRYKKLVLQDNRLVGMILVGKIEQAGVYAALIRKGADVGRLKDFLLREDFSYPYLLRRPA